MAPGADLAVQVGDGGPQLSNYGLPPGTPGPAISQIGFASDTIFSVAARHAVHSARQHPAGLVHGCRPDRHPCKRPGKRNVDEYYDRYDGFREWAVCLVALECGAGTPIAQWGEHRSYLSSAQSHDQQWFDHDHACRGVLARGRRWQLVHEQRRRDELADRCRRGPPTLTHRRASPRTCFSPLPAGAANVATTLDADFSIKGLTFTSAATSPVSIAGPHTLTLGADGLSLHSGAATATIGSTVTLGVSQTWTVDGGNPLVVNGTVSIGPSTTLTKSGTGTLRINAAPRQSATAVRSRSAAAHCGSASRRAPTIGTGVTAMVSAGATLELAGTASAWRATPLA